MIETVKEDEEVSLEYMKILEREEMLIREGQRMERKNTERERQRADVAEKELERLRQELKMLKALTR